MYTTTMIHNNAVVKDAGQSTLEKKLTFILILCLIGWSIFFINKGIDLTDTGYVLTKYQHILDNPGFSTVRTLFSDITGGVLFHAVPTHQVLFLNIAAFCIFCFSWIAVYLIFKPYMNPVILLAGIIGASFFYRQFYLLLHYNTFSLLLISVALLFLFGSIRRSNKTFLFLSGFVIGISIFFRLPNVLHALYVVAVFFYYYKATGKIRCGLKQSSLFVLGGIIAIFLGGMAAVFYLGYDSIISTILETVRLSSGEAVSANLDVNSQLTQMKTLIMNGFQSLCVWGVVCITLAIVLGKISKNRGKTFFMIPLVIMCALGIVIAHQVTIVYILNFIVVLSMILSCVGLIMHRQLPLEVLFVCFVNLIFCLINSMGTSNSSAYYCLFLAFPFVSAIYMILQLSRMLHEKVDMFCSKEIGFWVASEKMVLVFLLSLVLCSGASFGLQYIYRDYPPAQLTSEIRSDIYMGIKTAKEKADGINQLISIINQYPDQKLLTYGSFTIGSLITNLDSFFSTSWPDLESFPFERFHNQFQANIELSHYPVIVIMKDEPFRGNNFESDEKYMYIKQFIAENAYDIVYEDETYVIYNDN